MGYRLCAQQCNENMIVWVRDNGFACMRHSFIRFNGRIWRKNYRHTSVMFQCLVVLIFSEKVPSPSVQTSEQQ